MPMLPSPKPRPVSAPGWTFTTSSASTRASAIAHRVKFTRKACGYVDGIAENEICWRIGPSVTESRERVGDDSDRRLQCLEPLLAIPSMRPLARMAEDVALDVFFDGW